MAGIGFELRKLIRKDTLLSLLKAYAFAGLISSGPWVLSILGMLLIGFLAVSTKGSDLAVVQFQVTVTNIIGLSLVMTGGFQLAFTRFVADRLFEKKDDVVFGNYLAVLLVVTVMGIVLIVPAAFFFFNDTTLLYKLLLLGCFVTVSCIWISTVFLSGLKEYVAIVGLYGLGYAVATVAAALLKSGGLEGLLTGFLIGQLVLLVGMHTLIARNFNISSPISFLAFDPKLRYPTLFWIGMLYNLGAWIDKVIFWYWPSTSTPIIGILRSSVVYDLPVFLAYLSIIPGMAIFLVRIETDFVEFYDGFYNAVREGGSLELIEQNRNSMVETIRTGFLEILKVQTIAILMFVVAGAAVLKFIGISELYVPLLTIQSVAAGLQVLFLSILTVYFYLDERRTVLLLCILFVCSNAILTLISLRLGPAYYGYGFAISLLISVVAGVRALEKSMAELEYTTFMRR
jgi:polysaccharide biosynthesis protein PelG